MQAEADRLRDELARVKSTYGSEYDRRVEELVLGLGKQSAESISQYEQKIEALEKELQAASSSDTSTSATAEVVMVSISLLPVFSS